MALDGENERYGRLHVSFQPTKSWKLSNFDPIHQWTVLVNKREIVVGSNNHTWGIEMNAERYLYFGTYSNIDSIDHLIKHLWLKYNYWKYWHVPMLHAMRLEIVVSYDVYI